MSKILKSFKPIVDADSRVLVLGSMPGPEALRKQQYYGFEGNHFWTIIPKILGLERPKEYEDRIRLVRENGVALWDVLATCVRLSALDSAIQKEKPNPIPSLLKKFPKVRAIFINGRFAHKVFLKHFEHQIDRPVFYMPSTSPAHAAMTVEQKKKKWSAIKKFIRS